jgi:hypothetical protein
MVGYGGEGLRRLRCVLEKKGRRQGKAMGCGVRDRVGLGAVLYGIHRVIKTRVN